MNFMKEFKKAIPIPAKRFGRARLNNLIRKLKAPRMVWGYRDSTGEFRPRTRISDTVFMYHPEKIRIADNVFYLSIDNEGLAVITFVVTNEKNAQNFFIAGVRSEGLQFNRVG